VTAVYRAPMRSRCDDVDWTAAVRRALAIGIVGMGEAGDERAERRLDRFIAAPAGSFVWTRDGAGQTYVGQLTGPHRRDANGSAVDLVNVRDCDWSGTPVDPALIPAAVVKTFARGGRNFQRIHPGDVEAETITLWDRLNG
jgi:hypothetical protein